MVRLLAAHRPYSGRLALAVAALAALAGARLGLTWLTKVFADGPLARVGSAASADGLAAAGAEAGAASVAGWFAGPLALALALLFALALCVFLARAATADVERRVQRDLRDAAVRRLLAARRSSLAGVASGELGGRLVADVPAVAGFADLVCRRLVGEGLVALGAVGLMAWLAPRLALVLALVVPALAWGIAALSRGIRRLEGLARTAGGVMSGRLVEMLRGATTLKLLGGEDRAAASFAADSEALRRVSGRADLAAAALVAAVWLVTGLAVVAILAVGVGAAVARGGPGLAVPPGLGGIGALVSRWLAWLGVGGPAATALSPGELLAFCLAAVQVVEPVRRYADAVGAVQRILAAAERVFALVDWPEIEPRDGESLPPVLRGGLELVDLHFGYDPARPVLAGLDLVVAPGEHLAIVGASGAGKSTLAALLVRLEEPRRGELRLDGRPLAALALGDLRRAICLVEQDSALFAGTLAAALRLAAPEAREEELLAALSLVGLDGLVAVLPQGLEGRLGEGGRTLSGGERQRLALARAVLRDPAVLVLDEATSALDGETEAAIFARLAPWLAKRTVLVVAHRLATVQRWPRILVLAQGRVVGDGTFAALLSSCPAFAALVADQRERRDLALGDTADA
jgi:ABC-type multidrug transport system fused ATPase/permease subunit